LASLQAFLLILLVGGLLACGGGKNTEQKKTTDAKKEGKEDKSGSPYISKEVLSEIITSIPSSLEVTFLIKDLGLKFDKNFLSAMDKASGFKTDFKQALNLGIYSTDLVYANIYSQTQDVLSYLTAVNKLADALNIGEFFDFDQLKKLATSGSEIDTLMLQINLNLERINEHLQKKDRADLTILILTGGWIEALYLTCNLAKKSPHDLLNNRIGDQKVILDQLLLLLSFYEEEYPSVKELKEDLVGLNKVYENIKVTYNYQDNQTKKATPKEEDGILIIEDNVTSKINLTPKDLDKILETITAIRAKVSKT